MNRSGDPMNLMISLMRVQISRTVLPSRSGLVSRSRPVPVAWDTLNKGRSEQVLAALASPDRRHQAVGICRQWQHSTTNAAFFCSCLSVICLDWSTICPSGNEGVFGGLSAGLFAVTAHPLPHCFQAKLPYRVKFLLYSSVDYLEHQRQQLR